MSDRSEALRQGIREYLKSRDKEDMDMDEFLDAMGHKAGFLTRVTHTGKYIHPMVVSSGACVSNAPELPGYVSTTTEMPDVVGGAVGLPAADFLENACDGQLPELLLTEDADLQGLFQKECSFRNLRDFLCRDAQEKPAAHRFLKQVYFPLEDGSYHLLVPLFPTSLVNRAYTAISKALYGEEGKEARTARKAGLPYEGEYCEYPGLLRRSFGGTKPQNISRMNTQRGGSVFLLPSLPPRWKRELPYPLNENSVWNVISRFSKVRSLQQILVSYLEKVHGDYTNIRIHETRARLFEALATNVVQWGAGIRALPKGWSRDERCLLPPEEVRWLDPAAASQGPEDWKEQLCRGAARWATQMLTTDVLRMDEEERHYCRKVFEDAFRCFD